MQYINKQGLFKTQVWDAALNENESRAFMRSTAIHRLFLVGRRDVRARVENQRQVFILFAAVERHTITMLAKAHEREAQISLPGLAYGIELDQWAADPPAEPRGGARIENGAPDHVTGNAEGASAHKHPAITLKIKSWSKNSPKSFRVSAL